MSIRTLFFDDDLAAREHLASLLAPEEDMLLVGHAGTSPDAAERIRRERPDLLFLEVGAPQTEGFGLLSRIAPERMPVLIVMAASPQHALAAFEARALDYLLKPLQPGRLRRCLERARDYLQLRNGRRISSSRLHLLEDLESAPQYLTRLPVKEDGRLLFVRVEDIEWIEAADNYVLLHVGRQRHILREALGALEASLNPERFFRISRSALVNLDHLAELRPMFKGQHVVVLRDGSRLPMTRRVNDLQELLKFS